MSFELWLGFVIASMVLLIIPGPTILTVISYSISHGYKARMPLVVAIILGDSTALFLSLVGLGVVLAESAFWFQVIKWAGGLYLLYLGIQLLRSGAKGEGIDFNIPSPSRKKLFWNTYFITALNPKGIIFFVAFLPQFINPLANASAQLWILALTFVALATINAFVYALFAGQARRLLSSPKALRGFHFSGGGLISIAGIWALSIKQS
jgi:threonine/homoserine/homoserine lactone efflux protein